MDESPGILRISYFLAMHYTRHQSLPFLSLSTWFSYTAHTHCLSLTRFRCGRPFGTSCTLGTSRNEVRGEWLSVAGVGHEKWGWRGEIGLSWNFPKTRLTSFEDGLREWCFAIKRKREEMCRRKIKNILSRLMILFTPFGVCTFSICSIFEF